MQKLDKDLDTVTNMILNNEYKLHEDEENSYEINSEEVFDDEVVVRKPAKKKNSGGNHAKNKKRRTNTKGKKKRKKKKTVKQKIFLIFKILIALIVLFVIFVVLFFKTTLFQKYKELWVVTAMSTMKHQYLATWFLSDQEIQDILNKLEVKNDENSDTNEIKIPVVNDIKHELTKKDIKVENIKGKNYVGYVMIIPDASKVKLVDGRKLNRGSKLSEIVKSKNAIGGINAGGFADAGGVGSGNVLCDAVIMNKKLISGSKSARYSLIGLSADSKLVLGKYTYNEAMKAGIESAVEFGPYIIVNGKNQITNSSSGGIHPRMAIGQRKDGTFIFVVVDGRQPGYSLGTNLLELQNIFNKYDAYNAANLDGGSSATMYYNGKVVNKTSTPMGERYLPNAFIVEK